VHVSFCKPFKFCLTVLPNIVKHCPVLCDSDFVSSLTCQLFFSVASIGKDVNIIKKSTIGDEYANLTNHSHAWTMGIKFTDPTCRGGGPLENSLRWFAIDFETDIPPDGRKLLKRLQSIQSNHEVITISSDSDSDPEEAVPAGAPESHALAPIKRVPANASSSDIATVAPASPATTWDVVDPPLLVVAAGGAVVAVECAQGDSGLGDQLCSAEANVASVSPLVAVPLHAPDVSLNTAPTASFRGTVRQATTGSGSGRRGGGGAKGVASGGRVGGQLPSGGDRAAGGGASGSRASREWGRGGDDDDDDDSSTQSLPSKPDYMGSEEDENQAEEEEGDGDGDGEGEGDGAGDGDGEGGGQVHETFEKQERGAALRNSSGCGSQQGPPPSGKAGSRGAVMRRQLLRLRRGRGGLRGDEDEDDNEEDEVEEAVVVNSVGGLRPVPPGSKLGALPSRSERVLVAEGGEQEKKKGGSRGSGNRRQPVRSPKGAKIEAEGSGAGSGSSIQELARLLESAALPVCPHCSASCYIPMTGFDITCNCKKSYCGFCNKVGYITLRCTLVLCIISPLRAWCIAHVVSSGTRWQLRGRSFCRRIGKAKLQGPGYFLEVHGEYALLALFCFRPCPRCDLHVFCKFEDVVLLGGYYATPEKYVDVAQHAVHPVVQPERSSGAAC
jgi:hypothetical protein